MSGNGPEFIRWEPELDARTKPKTWGVDPDHGWPEFELVDGRYLSEDERRVMQGRYNCRGEYVLAPARPPRFPCEVPPRKVQGLRAAPEGTEEGDLCGRTYQGVSFCLGKLELRRDEDTYGACYCWRAAPCGSCMSVVPECPNCGHREPEPD